MKATKSKMAKQFDEHRERGLRCMADGGLVSNRMQRMEQMAGATAPVTLSANPGMASMTPQPVAAPAPAPAPVVQMTPEEAEWQRIKAEKLAPKPTLMSNVKKVFGFADGGMFDNVVSGSSTAPVASLRSVNPSFARRDPNAMKVRTIVNNMGVRGADGGTPADMIKRTGLRGALRYAEVHEGPGKVKGPIKGKDSVNAKLMPGEFVVPTDVVNEVGEENLAAMVAKYHTPKPESETMMPGDGATLRAADGVYVPGVRHNRMLPNSGPQPSAIAASEPAAVSHQATLRQPMTRVSPEAARYVQAQDAARAASARPPVAPTAAPASAAAPKSPGMLRRLGTGAVAAAPLAGFGDYQIDDPGVDSSAMGTLRNAGSRIVDMLSGTAMTEDREAGQAGLRKGAVEAGLDSVSGLAKTADFVAGMVGAKPDLAGRFESMVQGDLGEGVVTPNMRANPTASVPVAAARAANGNGGVAAAPQSLRDDGLRVTTTGDMSRNRVGPNGEIFGPGSEPITAGEQVVDSQGNVMRPGSISITGDGGPEPVGMQTRAGREAQLRAAYAPTQYAPADTRSLRERDPASFDMPAQTIGEQFDKDVAAKRGLRTQRLQMELDQRERDSQRQYGAANERNAVALRGQDMTAKTAGEAAVRDQANKDRQFKLDVAKYGTDVAEKNRAAASAADESLQKNLESRFRTKDADGKDVVDTAKIASFRTSVAATMPRMIEELEKTGKPAAIAKAAELRKRGTAAFEPGDWDNMQQWHDTRDRMRASKGMGPNQASMSESDNLLDFRQSGVEHRTFGGNRVVMPAGSISENDLRYTEPANKILPDWFKTEDRKLTRGLRRE